MDELPWPCASSLCKTSAMTGRGVRDPCRAHPLLGFPAGAGSCRMNQCHTCSFNTFLQPSRPCCYQVTAPPDHMDSPHPASHHLWFRLVSRVLPASGDFAELQTLPLCWKDVLILGCSAVPCSPWDKRQETFSSSSGDLCCDLVTQVLPFWIRNIPKKRFFSLKAHI